MTTSDAFIIWLTRVYWCSIFFAWWFYLRNKLSWFLGEYLLFYLCYSLDSLFINWMIEGNTCWLFEWLKPFPSNILILRSSYCLRNGVVINWWWSLINLCYYDFFCGISVCPYLIMIGMEWISNSPSNSWLNFREIYLILW